MYEEFQKIDSFSPDIIALSCMTSTFDFACDLVRSVKHKAIVIVGGVHATIAYQDCLDQECIDYAFVGEADRGIIDFIDALEKNDDPNKVPGLAYKKDNGEYVNNKVGPRVCLDDLPCPDWGLFDERHLFRPFEGKIYKGSFILSQEVVRCNVNIALINLVPNHWWTSWIFPSSKT